MIEDQSEPFGHPLPRFGGSLQNRDARTNRLEMSVCRLTIELAGVCQVDLRDQGGVGRVEQGRVFSWLVLAFGYREQGDPKRLTQVVTRRADEVADVLDEQHIQVVEVP